MAQHELAHLYGLGHSGLLRVDEEGDDELVLDTYTYEDAKAETSIELADLVRGANKDTYGDNSNYSAQYRGADGAIMGNPGSSDRLDASFSDYQLEQLGAAYDLQKHLNADIDSVTLEPSNLTISEPIVATVGNIEVEGFEEYDRVIVSPQQKVGMQWRIAEILIGSPDGDTLQLGRIYQKDGVDDRNIRQQYTFIGSEASAQVTFDNGSITVKKIS